MNSRSVTEVVSLNRVCLSCLYRLSAPSTSSQSLRRISRRLLHNGRIGRGAGQATAFREEEDSYRTNDSFSNPDRAAPREFRDTEIESPQARTKTFGVRDARDSRQDPEAARTSRGVAEQDGRGLKRPLFTRVEDERAGKAGKFDPQINQRQGWGQLRRRGAPQSAHGRPMDGPGQNPTQQPVEEPFQRDWGRKQGYVGFRDGGVGARLTFGPRHAENLANGRSAKPNDGRGELHGERGPPVRRDEGRELGRRGDIQARPRYETGGLKNNYDSPRTTPPQEREQRKGREETYNFVPVDLIPEKSSSDEPTNRDRKSWSAIEADAPKRRLKEEKANRRAAKFATADEEAEQFEEQQKVKAQRDRKAQVKKEKREAAKSASQRRLIELPQFISVGNLASMLKVRAEVFGEKLRDFGFEEVNNEHVLNFENASLVAMEYGYEPMVDRSESEDLKPRPPPVDVTVLPSRPPVVTIMGHVDHGKTTLLDYLRQSSVAASEHGGITQHIGAFSVPMASGSLITFLDTPGHAAFLSMRQRGANVTDIVVLVVAADDSVKPQTIEAIKHARAAKVPIIVAINKVDKDEADVEKVKQDLLVQELEVEDYGGDIQAIPVSGKTGVGLDVLEEAIITQAEILDMRAEKDGPVEGWVLEATTKRAGRVATVLVRRGTLRPGDVIVAGTTWGRVRTLKNEAGVLVDEVGPGMPVEVDGWRDQPEAGDEVLQAPNEQKATSVVEYRESKVEQTQAAKDMEAINENRRQDASKREHEKAQRQSEIDKAKMAGERVKARGKSLTMADAIEETDKKQLYFIIKADVSGSAEAIQGTLESLPLANQPMAINILRSGVGPVSEFDIDHIHAVPDGEGFIISFNQPLSPHIVGEAESVGARIIDESIIYKVIDEVKAIVESKLPPVISRRVTGEVELAQVFEINIGGRKTSKVAGCKVRNGSATKGGKVSVYRGGVGEGRLVYEGTITTLKSQKKDVPEMRKGTECGLSFDNWEDFKTGDTIQCYEEKSEPRRLT